MGTTSACAENTNSTTPSVGLDGNYLRVRGEYPFFGQVCAAVVELPPRARRILPLTNTPCLSYGTTSACAENTFIKDKVGTFSGNYLRVRGEYWSGLLNRDFV